MMRRLLVLMVLLWTAVCVHARPSRVVSMNLCVDQLAMMLAAPDQLISVSHVAADVRVSAMAKEAAAYVPNHALAEEVYLLRPDLVLASSYVAPITLDMLRRLGVAVAIFQTADSLQDVRQQIIQMGDVLGRQDAARVLLANYDSRLAALPPMVEGAPRAALYMANGYSAGDQSLAGQILRAAGFDNIASELGYPYFDQLPLELLVLSAPDLLVMTAPYPGASRAEAMLNHPVLSRLLAYGVRRWSHTADWVCGTPYVLRAIEELANSNKVGQ